MINLSTPSGVKLRDTDIRIVNELFHSSCLSMNELAKRSNLSRPTVTSHLRNMVESGLLIRKAGLSLKRMGYVTAVVGLEIVRERNRLTIEQKIKAHHGVEALYRTSGKANIHLQLWGENYQSLSSTIDSIRSLEGVQLVYSEYLGTPVFGDFAVSPPVTEIDSIPLHDQITALDEITVRSL